MFGSRETLDEAIADAKKLRQMNPGVPYCVVTKPYDEFQAVRRHRDIKPERIMWKSWSNYKPRLEDSEYVREVVTTNTRSEAARILGCEWHHVAYFTDKYGLNSLAYGVQIDIAELRAAMQIMTARAYAKKKGVNPARIYLLCREHNIVRLVKNRRGRHA